MIGISLSLINTYWTFGSLSYIVVLIISALIIVSLYFYGKKKSYKAKYMFLFYLASFNFVLHFAKLFFSPYNIEFFMFNDLRALRVVSMENICAVNTLVMPFILVSKNKYLKDYLFYIGTLGGLLALLVPVSPYTTREVLSFDMFRYFVCHLSLVICPLFMVLFKLHELDYKRSCYLPFTFLLCMLLIYLNECLLSDMGWLYNADNNYVNNFSNRRNFSFVFGPVESLGNLGKIFTCFTPENLKIYPVASHQTYPSLTTSVLYQMNVQNRLTPLLWIIIPSVIYLTIYAFIVSIFWDYKHFINDLNKIKSRFLHQ